MLGTAHLCTYVLCSFKTSILERVMDLEEFLKSYLYESDEARIDHLFSSIKT